MAFERVNAQFMSRYIDPFKEFRSGERPETLRVLPREQRCVMRGIVDGKVVG